MFPDIELFNGTSLLSFYFRRPASELAHFRSFADPLFLPPHVRIHVLIPSVTSSADSETGVTSPGDPERPCERVLEVGEGVVLAESCLSVTSLNPDEAGSSAVFDELSTGGGSTLNP